MDRIKSVDVFRLFAIAAVIVIHTKPFQGDAWADQNAWQYLGIFLSQLARFAVPFFFVISGYFWGEKLKKDQPISPISIAMAKRVLLIFAVWSLVYALPYNLGAIADYGLVGPIKYAYWTWMAVLNDPLSFFMQGTKVHLWFLIALVFSLVITACFVAKKKFKALMAVAILLYLLGLLSKAYADTPLGIHTDFDTRNGPFFGTIFFASGYFLSTYTPNSSWFLKGLLIFGAGFILHFSELYFLSNAYGVSVYQDYVAGTYFMGMGMAIAALSNAEFLQFDTLSKYGKFTLGLYAVHIIFVDVLRPIGRWTNFWLWEFVYVALVFLLSAVCVLALSRIKATRAFVM
ncbi:acyltransferase [Undibacterium terreum]|uniref:Fucose 4-O-acetylase n=1 Tax=Undibacterium terreum TaxID=1224302 RepID=A0A916V1S4_9BURK|nr:acyltransferase [Undibacterium terreum]GGC97010.1 fucose 4-O-acetylase [Undibacterium terreum]